MRRLGVVVAVVAVAAGSLTLPAAPIFDAWVWMGWGRDLRVGSIDAAGPTAWKPFTAAAGLLLSPLGNAAPTGWLFVVRVAALATLVAVALTAARLSTRPRLAAALAMLVTLSLRHVVPAALHGASEVVLGALLAGAAAAGVPLLLTIGPRDRPRHELGCAALLLVAGTIRPEVWPAAFVVTALVVWRRPFAARAAAAVAAVAMIGVWFLPTGGAAATQARRSPAAATTGPASVLVDALTVAPVAATALALVAVLVAVQHGRGRRAHGGLAVLALAAVAVSIAGVAVLEGTAGYPAIARFVLAVGPLVAVLAAAGAQALAARAPAPVLAVVIGVLAFEALGPRLVDGRETYVAGARQAAAVDDLRELVRVVGQERLRSAPQLCVAEERHRSAVAFLVRRSVTEVCGPPAFESRSRRPDRAAIVVRCGSPAAALPPPIAETGECAAHLLPAASD